jgi:hypothetical protein
MSAKKATMWQVVKSVCASMIGVQSESNRQADFEQTSFIPYLVVGVVFVAVLVLGLIAFVRFLAS